MSLKCGRKPEQTRVCHTQKAAAVMQVHSQEPFLLLQPPFIIVIIIITRCILSDLRSHQGFLTSQTVPLTPDLQRFETAITVCSMWSDTFQWFRFSFGMKLWVQRFLLPTFFTFQGHPGLQVVHLELKTFKGTVSIP